MGQENLILGYDKSFFLTNYCIFGQIEGDISIHWKVIISKIAR